MAQRPCFQAGGLLVGGCQASHVLVRPSGGQQSDAKRQHCVCVVVQAEGRATGERTASPAPAPHYPAQVASITHFIKNSQHKAAGRQEHSRCTWSWVAGGGQVLLPPLLLCLGRSIMAAVHAIGNLGSCSSNAREQHQQQALGT